MKDILKQWSWLLEGLEIPPPTLSPASILSYTTITSRALDDEVADKRGPLRDKTGKLKQRSWIPSKDTCHAPPSKHQRQGCPLEHAILEHAMLEHALLKHAMLGHAMLESCATESWHCRNTEVRWRSLRVCSGKTIQETTPEVQLSTSL